MKSLCALLLLASPALGGEIVRLTPETWKFVPGGKEVDAVYGDWLMRNDKVVAVIGDAVPGRNANMSCKYVQGAVIDFTTLESNNDQLSVFYPHGDRPFLQAAKIEVVSGSGPELVLRATRPPTELDPVEAVTEYALKDGEISLRVTTRYRNTGARALRQRLADKMRADQTFAQAPAGEVDIATFYDKWFGAAYAVAQIGGRIRTDGKFGGLFGANSGTWLEYSENQVELAPGAEHTVVRHLIAGRHLAEVQKAARRILRQPFDDLTVFVTESGKPVAGVDVVVLQGLREISAAFTDAEGRAVFSTPGGDCTVEVTQIGRAKVVSAAAGLQNTLKVSVGPRSQIDFDIVDGEGRPVAFKAQFVPIEDTPPLNLGPKQRARGCTNLYFSPVGRCSVPLPPGRYLLIVSHGPEHDAATRSLALREGETVRVSSRLPRVVNSAGWISADFHNHSTESGDNTTETESRLICLAAEGLEFAASTEHNRIVTYRDRLRALGLERLVATSDGMELTGSPLPIMHQNAFPLVEKPRTQDGGGPLVAKTPLEQMKRLFDHDGGAEKLIQQNHPDIGWLFYDMDSDGQPDQGFGTYPLTNVIEVWAPEILALKPFRVVGPERRNNVVFNWLQLLNQGFRLPGVANTDAHYCLHESGRIRNYVKSPTDDPAKIQEMDIVRESKKGHLVMTNGPFLDVSLNGALPGDELRLEGKGVLKVRVECANWLDVDRVQVLVNGRPDPALNFTRATHPAMFRAGPLKFQEEIPISLAADAHLIVVAVGEHATCGPVMGQNIDPPTAVANPIYVDVDGGGFMANKDTLGAPLPVRKLPTK